MSSQVCLGVVLDAHASKRRYERVTPLADIFLVTSVFRSSTRDGEILSMD